MTAHYRQILYTPDVKAAQDRQGGRPAHEREPAEADAPDLLTLREAAFIGSRDSFYMATVSSSGWPYMQHRGGPAGFVHTLDAGTLGFADFAGNRQYLSLGNLAGDDRTALFFMDYANRARLKVLGRIRFVPPDEAPELAARLIDPDYRARVERLALVGVEAYDWNCPQHITPRVPVETVEPSIRKLTDRIAELEAELARRA